MWSFPSPSWRRAFTSAVALATLGCRGVVVDTPDPEEDAVGLAVHPHQVTLAPGQHAQFTSYALLADGDSAPIPALWSATGGTVTGDGMFAADSAAGAFTVVGTHRERLWMTDTADVQVTSMPAPVGSVTVTPAVVNLRLGNGVQLAATVRDTGGIVVTDRPVTWTSNAPTIASVTSGGQVQAHAIGGATITATSEGEAGSAAVTVSAIPVASVTIDPTSASLVEGQSTQLTATPRDSAGTPLTGRPVTWATGNGSVATVNAGLVQAVGAGQTAITATSEGKSASATVTVSLAPVATVSVEPQTASLLSGDTLRLTATPRDAAGTPLSGRPVTWSTSNGAVATVVAGLVTGQSAGQASIIATSGGKSGSASITVSVVPVASVTVSPAAATRHPGQSVQLTATMRDASGTVLSGRPVTWTTSNGSVASVSGAGLVMANAVGQATITATSEGHSDAATITVTPVPVATVTVSPTMATLQLTQTVQLTATPRDSAGNALAGRVITWSTSNGGIASVVGGLVTGVTLGSATITATSEGKSGTAQITVQGSSSGQVLFVEGFEDNNFAARGWYDNGAFATTTAEKVTGARALEVRFTAGATGPSWGGGRHLFTATESVYLSYWVKYSSNWIGSGQPYHPHEFQFLTTEEDAFAAPAWTRLSVLVEHNYQSGGIPLISWSDGRNVDTQRIGQNLTGVTEQRAVAGCNGDPDGYGGTCYTTGGGLYFNGKSVLAGQPYFRPNPGPGYKGDWHFIEAFIKLNTIQSGVANTDGIIQYWFDGELVIDVDDAQLRTGARPNMKFNQFLMAPFIGDGSPVTQTFWVDDLRVATGRP